MYKKISNASNDKTVQLRRHLEARPDSPHGTTNNPTYQTAFHHLVPYNMLKQMSKDLTSTPGHKDAAIYMKDLIPGSGQVTVENLVKLRLVSLESGVSLGLQELIINLTENIVRARIIDGIQANRAWDSIRDYKEKHLLVEGSNPNQADQLDLGEREEEILSWIAWSPGNLVEGPKESIRANDPGEHFDWEATEALNDEAHKNAVHELHMKAKKYKSEKNTINRTSLTTALSNYAPYKNTKTTLTNALVWQEADSLYSLNPAANQRWKGD